MATASEANYSSRSEDASLDATQEQLAKNALNLIGKTKLAYEGKVFPFDCYGTVMSAIVRSGIDVTTLLKVSDSSGVRSLYKSLSALKLIYKLPLPEVGDVIFWDNTWDANEDLQWDDELTHIGIVVSVEADGTIHYVHHNYRLGICEGVMNLFHPDVMSGPDGNGKTKTFNSGMRMVSQIYLNPGQTLASQLFRAFGSIHLLVEAKASIK